MLLDLKGILGTILPFFLFQLSESSYSKSLIQETQEPLIQGVFLLILCRAPYHQEMTCVYII